MCIKIVVAVIDWISRHTSVRGEPMRRAERELFQFEWAVPEAGFEWKQEKGKLLLYPRSFRDYGGSAGEEPRLRSYSPLRDHTGLFREFGAVPRNPDGVLAFATKFGSLGLLGPDGRPESFGEWDWSIQQMRWAIDIWDGLVIKEKEGVLSEHIKWRKTRLLPEGEVYFDGGDQPYFAGDKDSLRGPYEVSIASEQMLPELFRRMCPGDVRLPAWLYLQQELRLHLKNHVFPRPIFDPDHSEMTLVVVPGSLIGALWLQFANAIQRKARYGNCVECREWFKLSGKERMKEYCSAACRTRAWRTRSKNNKARRPPKKGK